MRTTADLPTVTSLDELTRLVTSRSGLYVRRSLGPEHDLPRASSKDDLAPGISGPGMAL